MITKQIKEQITKQFIFYKGELNILEEVRLEFKGEGNSGNYAVRNGVDCVRLENKTIEQWFENPQRTKFAMIHELVHAKYKDIKKCYLNTPLVSGKVILDYLLRELRANTIAYQMLGSNISILEDYFFNYYGHNSNNYVALSAGYVSARTNVELIMANQIWDKQAIEDAIEFFLTLHPKLRKISKEKIEGVKNKFIEQLEV